MPNKRIRNRTRLCGESLEHRRLLTADLATELAPAFVATTPTELTNIGERPSLSSSAERAGLQARASDGDSPSDSGGPERPEAESQTMHFTAASYLVSENGDAIGAKIQVVRSSGTGTRSFAVQVQAVGANSTAALVDGPHTIREPLRLRFEDGETTKTLYVSSVDASYLDQRVYYQVRPIFADSGALLTLRDDAIHQNQRDFQLRLQAPASQLGQITSAVVSVVDNDAPQIVLTESDNHTTLMANSNVDTLQVALNYRPSTPVTVMPFYDEDVLSVTPSQLVFTSDNWQTQQSLHVQGRQPTSHTTVTVSAVASPEQATPQPATLAMDVRAPIEFVDVEPELSVANIANPAFGLNPINMFVVDDHLYFHLNKGGGIDQWRTDGTAPGTEPLNSSQWQFRTVEHQDRRYRAFYSFGWFDVTADDPRSGERESILSASQAWNAELVSHLGHVYFTNGGTLWSTTGRRRDVRTRHRGFAVRDLTPAGENIYFTSRGNLFAANSQLDTAVQLHAGPVTQLTAVDQTLYFLSRQQHGHMLGFTDGTAAGTRLLPTVFPPNFQLQQLSQVGETLFVQGLGQRGTPEVWRVVPATTSATTELKAEYVGAAWRVDDFQGRPLLTGESLSLVGGDALSAAGRRTTAPNVFEELFFFGVETPTRQHELWKSDGTTAGTTRLATLRLGSQQGEAELERLEMVEFQGRYYFAADDGTSGTELWSTDGTAAGTRQVYDAIQHWTGIRDLTSVDGRLVFFGADGVAPAEQVWQVQDQTANMILAIENGHWNRIATSRDTTLFTFRYQFDDIRISRRLATELWLLDDTSPTPRLVGSVTTPSIPRFGFTPVGPRNVFLDDDKTVYSDGIRIAGQHFEQLELDGLGTSAAQFIRVGDSLFFSALDSEHGRELWVTQDGLETYQRLTDVVAGRNPGLSIQTGEYQRLASEFVAFRGQLYFTAAAVFVVDDSSHSETEVHQIWQSDGTTEGTRLLFAPEDGHVANLTVDQGRLYFTSQDSARLYVTDGTTTGTRMLRQFQRLGDEFVVRDGRLFFAADGGDGMELWASDGTPAGTKQVADIVPGPEGSQPSDLTLVGEQLFFAATDDVAGRELWTTDGTADGTKRMLDLQPGPAGSRVDQLTAVGDELFFVTGGTEYGGGNRLWRMNVAPNRQSADADGDGKVDMQDFLILAAHYGQRTADGRQHGDFDQSDVVDFQDFLLLSHQFDGRR